jgi:hypothetical protein
MGIEILRGAQYNKGMNLITGLGLVIRGLYPVELRFC